MSKNYEPGENWYEQRKEMRGFTLRAAEEDRDIHTSHRKGMQVKGIRKLVREDQLRAWQDQ